MKYYFIDNHIINILCLLISLKCNYISYKIGKKYCLDLFTIK